MTLQFLFVLEIALLFCTLAVWWITEPSPRDQAKGNGIVIPLKSS
jgi:hypothetical protein